MPSFLAPLLSDSEQPHALYNTRDGTIIACRLEGAFDSETRRRGLLGRDKLDQDAALIIAPCSSVHTFFMRFSIDVVFAARDGRVVKTFANLRPWRMAFGLMTFAAIELAEGAIVRCGIQRGDRLRIGPLSEHSRA